MEKSLLYLDLNLNSMKKLFILTVFVLLFAGHSSAQRFAYVDSDFILESIPEYKTAQRDLDKLALDWQKDIDSKFLEVDNMRKKYQAEQFLMTKEMKDNRLREIAEKEKAAQELQRSRFGYEGELFVKRQELIEPIQGKVYAAVQKVAEERAFDFIFDKASGGATLFYTNTKHDLSEIIIKRLVK